MVKPVLVAVDDDAGVLWSVSRDLRNEYGSRFRIVQAETGAEALEAVRQLKQRDEPVALFLVDQRMPQMSGVEFLERAKAYYPDGKRVLLTAYADTDAAIQAINHVGIDYYLLKPWDPPEERLYPVLQDLLDDWLASYRPPFEGVRLVGLQWSPRSHDIKDFLARNQIPCGDRRRRSGDPAGGAGPSLRAVLHDERGGERDRPGVEHRTPDRDHAPPGPHPRAVRTRQHALPGEAAGDAARSAV